MHVRMFPTEKHLSRHLSTSVCDTGNILHISRHVPTSSSDDRQQTAP